VSLPFDDLAADQYALIRADLEGRGQLIGANDLLIAAIARAHDLTLVTHNMAEFSRVGRLELEDWEGA
jgi:tRNA(fMet)-specific endonuclease VapC